MNNKFAIFLIGIGIAVFFCPIKAVSKVEFPKPLFRYQPESGFFIGEDMRICEIAGCNEKHRAKGLCSKHYRKKQYQNNKDKELNQNKQWREDNPNYYKQYKIDNKERIAKRDKQWYQNNKEHRRQYEQDNKEKILKRNKQWYQDNPKYRKQYQKRWKQTLAGKASKKTSDHNRRALKKGLTKETVQRVYEDNIKKYGILTCVLCGKPIKFKDDSLEHLTPLSRGGSNLYENLGIAHYICNVKKHTMTLEEFLITKGR